MSDATGSPARPWTPEHTDWPTLGDQGRVTAAHRLVLTGLFLTLVWKWSFFVAADRVYRMLPIRDEFFPAALQSQATLRGAFILAIATILVSGLTGNRRLRIGCGWTLQAAVTVLCLHQGSYNDMTFATAWWTSLWSLWFVHRMEGPDPNELLRRGATLGRAILSMILLGGAVGKWTAEYWSGEVLYEIYFVERDFWIFNWLRSMFDEATLREIATWYSRKVVVVETVCGFCLWRLPPRWAAGVGAVVFVSIAVFSNFLLFSVLSCLIGLALVGFLVPAGGQAAATQSAAS